MKLETLGIILVLLLATHLGSAGAGWYWAKTRYELRETKDDNEALVADGGRRQRADVVAGGHAVWQQKQAAVVAVEERKIEQAIELDPDWNNTAIPPGVRAALAAAAVAITTTEYVDAQLPNADTERPGNQQGAAPRLGGGAQGMEGMPRAASAPG